MGLIWVICESFRKGVMIWRIGYCCIMFVVMRDRIILDDLKMLDGWVLLRPLVQGDGAVFRIGDVELEIPGDFAIHRVANVIGEVLSVCGGANVSRGMIEPSLIDLDKGDLVWYGWNSVRDGGDMGKLVEVEGIAGKCLLVEYERCFCYVPSGDISRFTSMARSNARFELVRGLNGYCLGVPLTTDKEVSETASGLFLGASESVETRSRKVRVVSIGSPLVRYCVPEYSHGGDLIDEEFYPRDVMSDIAIGDVVILDKSCNLPIEGDYSRMLVGDGGVIPYRFQRKDVLCVVSDDIADRVEVKERVSAADGINPHGMDRVEYERAMYDDKRIMTGARKSYLI